METVEGPIVGPKVLEEVCGGEGVGEGCGKEWEDGAVDRHDDCGGRFGGTGETSFWKLGWKLHTNITTS